jgi:hypothetical protein
MIRNVWLALMILSAHIASFGSEGPPSVARLAPVALDVPATLQGPQRSFPNPQSELDVYASRGDLPPTLLELLRVVIPQVREDLSEQNRAGAASSFLDGFMTQFSANVSGWKRLPTEDIRLGGAVAVRATWSGVFHGNPTKGVMYVLVLGKQSYCFHALGQSDVSNDALASAVRAIEQLRIERSSEDTEAGHR